MAESTFPALLLCLCLSYNVCCHALQIPREDRRLTLVYRRGDVSGLFPFPRVGRSQVPNSAEDNFGQRSPGPEQGSSVSKRQGLIPFPRVGKRQPVTSGSFVAGSRTPSSDALYDEYAYQGRQVKGGPTGIISEDDPWGAEAPGKRSGEVAVQEGMWFGPRLGKRRRRRSAEGQGGSPGHKHHPRQGAYWPEADESRGYSREYLDRRPLDFESIFRKELIGASDGREDEDDFLSAEDPADSLYAEEAGPVGGAEEATAGRRRRRRTEDDGAKKASPAKHRP